MINPYAGVDFSTAQKIVSVSHQHLSHSQDYPNQTQRNFDDIYASGVRHFAISRYRPSINTYPFDYDSGTFEYVANPLGVEDDLETLKTTYARTISFPADVIGSPNAEHPYVKLKLGGTWTQWNAVHINGLGSTFTSGTTPNPTYQNPSNAGTYEECIDGIVANLQVPDGGGVIINHPQWTIGATNGATAKGYDYGRFLMDCLDYAPDYVLGTDISESKPQSRIPDNMALWDRVLVTGRRCWGFGEGDWNTDVGRNVLLIPAEVTDKENLEKACLRAYRNGAFFSRWRVSDLTLTGVSFDGDRYEVNTAGADYIQIIVDGVAREPVAGNTASVSGLSEATYVRAIAWTETDGADELYDDIIFVQPVMIHPLRYRYEPAYADAETAERRRRSIMRSCLWS